jgi:hypothetical protein
MTVEQAGLGQRIAADLESVIPAGAVEDAGEILVEWPISISTTEASITTSLSILRGKRCAASRILDVSGGGVTDTNGLAVIRLKDVTCRFPPPQAGENFVVAAAPLNVVATARGSDPRYLTTRIVLKPQDRDAEIQIFAWDPQGQAAGSVAFYWRCTVALVENVG